MRAPILCNGRIGGDFWRLLCCAVLCQVYVAGQVAPTISQFRVSPTSIPPGGSASLTWATQGATSVSISPGIGRVSASGSINVSPANSTTYTITAQNQFGSSTATADLTVDSRLPQILRFTVTPPNITPGATATLTWATQGATSVSINNGVGRVSSSGSVTVTPQCSTGGSLPALPATGCTITFTLTASNQFGVSNATTALSLVQANFTLNPLSLDFGTVGVGFSPTLSFAITPTGAIDEIDIDTRSAPGFSVVGSPSFALPSAQSVTVAFTPTTGGSASGVIVVTAPHFGISKQISVEGTGIYSTIIPHSAFGSGFLTRLFITNLASTANHIVVNRMGQNGSTVDSRPITLDPNAMVILVDTDDKRLQPLTIQWFGITSNSPISASVLFDTAGAGSTSVGALSAAPLPAFTAPVRIGGGFTDGVALVNLGNSSSTLNLTLMAQDGSVAASDFVVLGSSAQTAFVLTDRPAFQNFQNFTGSLQVSPANPALLIAGMVVGSQDGKLFSLPVASAPAALASPLLGNLVPAATFQTVIPHSAFGGGFISRLFVANLANTSNFTTIFRFDQAGHQVDVRTVTLQPHATFTLEDSEDRRNQPLTVQWFAIDSASPVAAAVLFDSLVNGIRNPVGALSSPPLTNFAVPIRQTRDATTGVAILNLSGQDSNINLRLLDASGSTKAQDLIALHGFSQTSFVVTDRPLLRQALCPSVPCADFTGSLSVTTGGPGLPVAAMVVGTDLGQIFSLPVQQTPQ
jgi:hypothetical protein